MGCGASAEDKKANSGEGGGYASAPASAPAAGGAAGAGTMDCKFLEACGSGDSTLTPDEMKKMCESMECENIGEIGKAAEKLAEKLGGFEPVLAKLQKDVGDATWQKIVKEYEKYSSAGAPAAGGAGAGTMDCKFLEACGSGDSTLTPDEMKKMCESMDCENIGEIGKAAEKLAEKLGGFEPVLAKLQKDVGDETWQKILKEYEKYSGTA